MLSDVVRCCQMLKESEEESPSLCSSSSPLTSDSPLYITRTGNGKLLVRCRSAPCLRSAWCCWASCSSSAPTLPRRPTSSASFSQSWIVTESRHVATPSISSSRWRNCWIADPSRASRPSQFLLLPSPDKSSEVVFQVLVLDGQLLKLSSCREQRRLGLEARVRGQLHLSGKLCHSVLQSLDLALTCFQLFSQP